MDIDHDDQKNQDGRKPRRTLAEMQNEALLGEGDGGLKCPQCQCRDFRVSNTWKQGKYIKRLRKCRHCGYPVNTCELEIPDGHELEVKKIENS